MIGVAGLSASYNPYIYVRGNPVNLVDPSGELADGVSAAVLMGVAFIAMGAYASGSYAAGMYDLAETGRCGCAAQDWARSNSRSDVIAKAAITGGAAVGLGIVATLTGYTTAMAAAGATLSGFGVATAAIDMAQNGPNLCNALNLFFSAMGIIIAMQPPMGPSLQPVPLGGGVIGIQATNAAAQSALQWGAWGSTLGAFYNTTGGDGNDNGSANDEVHNVYTSRDEDGNVQYVGITNDIARRQAEHLRTKGIFIEPLIKNLSRADARAVEQALIEMHGISKSGGTLMNRINSIRLTNPDYATLLQRGYDLLESIGYKG